MEERNDVTVPMEQSLVEEIAAELDYGDSRAEWIREAIRMRLRGEFADEKETETETEAETDGGRVVRAN